MGSVALQRPGVAPGESRWASVSCADLLDDSELLSGTPVVEEMSTSDLTLSNEAVNTSQMTINGVVVPIGKAIRFYVTGAVVGITYRLKLTFTTNSSPAQTCVGIVYLAGACNT